MREPDLDPLGLLTTEVPWAERPEALSYEDLHSTEILTGSSDDDDEVQAEKPAGQRL